MRDALLAELQNFFPHDEAERRHREAILSLLRSDQCASRHSYEPGHLTASAFIIDPATERLLLHHHRRLGRWLQMGGHIEPGETAVQAAAREAREESGLRDAVPFHQEIFDLDVHRIPRGGEPEHHHFDVRYVFRTGRPDDIAILETESLSLKWFTLDEAAEQMDEPCSRRAIDKIRRLLH